jgi:hypothetical protein
VPTVWEAHRKMLLLRDYEPLETVKFPGSHRDAASCMCVRLSGGLGTRHDRLQNHNILVLGAR